MTSRDPLRVILIGGSPMSGKTTVARAVAAQIGFSIIATDDLAAAVRGATSPAVAPDLFAACSQDHRDYYISHSVGQLLADAQRSHRALWPAIASVIYEHATWASPSIIEGWALLPDLVAKLDLGQIAPIWIEVPASVLDNRARQDTAFHAGASDPELMIRRFTERSIEFAVWLRAQTQAFQLPHVRLSGAETPEEACHAVLREIEGGRLIIRGS